MSDLLKIAVPNKGALAESAAGMLTEAGYRQRTDMKDLVLIDGPTGSGFYLRPATSPSTSVRNSRPGHHRARHAAGLRRQRRGDLSLGFGVASSGCRPRQRHAARRPEQQADRHQLPGLLRRYLDEKGVDARLIHLDGAVESSIRLGVADAIADVVETGTTLRRAGLELFGEPILDSEAILVRRPGSLDVDQAALDHLLQRLSGVLVARNYVLMDYDIPTELLEQASALTPGLESPTVSPLAKPGWVAVRALVPAKDHQLLMDDLHDLGARAILVTELSACRL